MIAILAVGFFMAALSVWFWYLELRLFLDAVEGRTWWMIPFCAITNIHRLVPFLFDAVVTLFCVANLGFGGGVIGGITGLFISNVISCFILYHAAVRSRIRDRAMALRRAGGPG